MAFSLRPAFECLCLRAALRAVVLAAAAFASSSRATLEYGLSLYIRALFLRGFLLVVEAAKLVVLIARNLL